MSAVFYKHLCSSRSMLLLMASIMKDFGVQIRVIMSSIAINIDGNVGNIMNRSGLVGKQNVPI
jgi:hypothetical protein